MSRIVHLFKLSIKQNSTSKSVRRSFPSYKMSYRERDLTEENNIWADLPKIYFSRQL